MPATAPLAGDVHVNVPLTNFAQRYLQAASNFVGLRAFPNLPVSKQSDLYFVFDKESFLTDDAEERADGTESVGGSFGLSQDPYYARVYAFHKKVTDRQRANADSQIKLEQSASNFVVQKMLIKRERVFVDKMFTAGVWNFHSVVNTDWSVETASPIEEIRTQKREVQLATGYRPNRMLIGRTGFDTLMDNDEILSRIIGGSTTAMPAHVKKQHLTELLELDEILVMDSVVSTLNAAKTENEHKFIGSDDALLYYAPMTLDAEEPTAGIQFSWTGFMGATDNGMRIKKFRKESVESDIVEAQMAFDYKRTSAELGVFFSSVSST